MLRSAPLTIHVLLVAIIVAIGCGWWWDHSKAVRREQILSDQFDRVADMLATNGGVIVERAGESLVTVHLPEGVRYTTQRFGTQPIEGITKLRVATEQK
ncbi:MAG: hypothetical protein WD872_20475 [Pirellulaceae bacterium]